MSKVFGKWIQKLNRENVCIVQKHKFSIKYNDNTGRISNCVIAPDVLLEDDILEKIFNMLDEDGDLYIIRNRKKVDFAIDQINLVRMGFHSIVQLKNTEYNRKGYILHCRKGVRVPQFLSIICPVYNEENTVKNVIDGLLKKDWKISYEIVIVESNSTDHTREIVMSYSRYPNIKIILEEKASGKGKAVLHGIREASGNIIAIQDGDLEYDINDYDKLLAPLINYESLFVLGSRYKKDDWRMRKLSENEKWIANYLNIGQKILTGLINITCNSKLTDPFTMYKIFYKECMYGINFKGNNFALDWEIIVRFLRKRYKPVEIPINYQARSYADGKHINLILTPLEGILTLIRCRFLGSMYDYGD